MQPYSPAFDETDGANLSTTPAPQIPLVASITFLLGLGVVAWGLAVARSRDQFGWLPPEVKSWMRIYIENNQAVVVGGAITLVGALLVGLATRRVLPDKLAGLALPVPLLSRDGYALVALGLAAACQGLLYWHILGRQYTHWDILLFFASLVLVGFAVQRFDRPTQRPKLHFTRLDLAAIPALGALAVAVDSIELTRWNFAWIGDEGAFFSAAELVAKDTRTWNFFNLAWVYNAHPALDTVYQALVMKAFGPNVFGWRFSEVLMVAGTTMLMYPLAVALFGRLAALASCVVLFTNNYLMAFSRIGYNNAHMVFYATLLMLMLALAWRTQRAVFVFATGAAMGFCLYTFMGAILMWPIVALLLLIIFLRRPDWKQVFAGGIMLVGFVLVVIPGVLTTTLDRLIYTASHNSYQQLANDMTMRISLVDSTLSFWSNYQWRNHFVGGPLLDELTGILLVIGLSTALFRINKRSERLAFAWFVVGLLLIALSDFASEAHLTRLLLLVPAVSLLAGLAIARLERVLHGSLRLSGVAAHAVILLLLAVIPVLNVYKLLSNSPTGSDAASKVMLMKAIQEHPGYLIVQVGSSPIPDAQTPLMLSEYPWYGDRYSYMNAADLVSLPLGELQANPSIYFVSTEDQPILQDVDGKLSPDYKQIEDTYPPDGRKVWLFEPPQKADTK